jgi:hypothetical protein
MNRRKFIQNTLLSSLACNIPSLAFSNEGALKKHFVVQLLAGGGLDATLSLDPLMHSKYTTDQKDIFLEYRPEDILKNNQLYLGPAAHPLKDFMSQMSTINGIVMRRDIGHDNLLDYIATGSGNGDLASLSVEADYHSSDSLLGVLINNSVKTGHRKPSLNQINEFSQKSDESEFLSQNLITGLKQTTRKKSRLYQSSLSMLNLSEKEESFKHHMNHIADLSSRDTDEVVVIASAFSKNLANSVVLDLESLDLDFNLDTHSNHEQNHFNGQVMIWEYIADLFRTFKDTPYADGSLFDNTTFVVMTEFSRTPYLNPAKGKDHNVYTNSVLIAGGKVNGGKSFGESKVIKRSERPDGRALHIGKAFDFEASKPVDGKGDGVGLIFPENVIKSFSPIVNNSADFYSSLSDVKPIKGLFKS